jgi:geranylgeranyl transferase type-1 subunit beta
MDDPKNLIKKLQRHKHIHFLKRCLDILPASTASLDTSRLTVAFFALSGIDLLVALDPVLRDRKPKVIDWIYEQQISHDKGIGSFGFRGSSANGKDHPYDFGHLAMTYTALSSLLVLGDDLSKVNKQAIIDNMKELQLESGSFAAVYGSESDMRFVYCAATICHILQDWSGIDVDKATDFIASSLSYEGAFGQGPGYESHGGSTYCAVASLLLMRRLDDVLNPRQIERLKRWCLFKQVDGFQGRPNKDPDTCYSFWIGATLKLLNAFEFVNVQANVEFVLATEDDMMGGLAKYPDTFPDVLHTFLGISGLALIADHEGQLQQVDPSLNISKRAQSFLQTIQART